MNKFYPALLVTLLSLFLAPSHVQAQRARSSEDSLQYIVDSRPDSTRHGFFSAGRFNSTFHVQFDGDVTYMFGQYAALTGFQVAWVLNHKLSFGVKYDILSSPLSINKYVNSNDYNAEGVAIPIHPVIMSATITFGYILRASKKISIEPTMNVGWAYISFSDPKSGWIDTTEAKTTSYIANYLVINPTISFIWNTTRYFRIGIELGAKGVIGKDYLRVKSYRVGGVYGGLFLRFGTF
jgi:hypothetical protein